LNKEIDEITDGQLTRKAPEREGLPAGYRMRADAHYVDQLTSRSADMPVRWIPLDDISGGGSFAVDELRVLVQSIVEHGIVQPLLVRQSGAQYRLIAGRKRLAAARSASLQRVPCLVHQVDDTQADALARADNLRVDVGGLSAVQGATPLVTNLIGHVSEAVNSIESASTLLVDHQATMAQRVALDLVKAETWRAAWQLRAAAILENVYDWHYRVALLGPLLGRVREGFAAETRLSGIVLRLNLPDPNVAAEVDEESVVCATSGAILAMAGLVGKRDVPEVSVAVRASSGKALSIDVTQEVVAVAAPVVARFLDPTWLDRPGGWPSAMGIAAARAVAEKHSGELMFLPRDGRGSTTRLTLGR
jgi:hypothetical protein